MGHDQGQGERSICSKDSGKNGQLDEADCMTSMVTRALINSLFVNEFCGLKVSVRFRVIYLVAFCSIDSSVLS